MKDLAMGREEEEGVGLGEGLQEVTPWTTNM